MMNSKKMEKLMQAKQRLINEGLLFNEFSNGYLIVNGVSYWSTREKFYDYRNQFHGMGLDKFVEYVKEMKE